MAADIVLHAPNVHQGGGLTLLRGLLSALDCPRLERAILDARLALPPELAAGLQDVPIRRVAPRLADHFQAERTLAQWSRPSSHILAFHGLPPLFRCRGQVTVFVQNRNVVDQTDISEYPLWSRVRIGLERWRFRQGLRNADQLIVQSETMRRLVRDRFPQAPEIQVLPFCPDEASWPPPSGSARRHDFCYVSSGEPHKNHRHLVEAWVLLAQQGLFPALCLTLCPVRERELCDWISRKQREFNLQIENRGLLEPAGVEEVYRQADGLIFPSRYESFGLPLVEAARLGLPILASERDYVWDVCVPAATFDPESPLSIARAVQRRLGCGIAPAPVLSPHEFVSRVFDQPAAEESRLSEGARQLAGPHLPVRLRSRREAAPESHPVQSERPAAVRESPNSRENEPAVV